MSVIGKTFGIVLIGLMGLLAYIAIYIGSAYGVSIAHGTVYLGLVLTAVLMIVIVILANGREEI